MEDLKIDPYALVAVLFDEDAGMAHQGALFHPNLLTRGQLQGRYLQFVGRVQQAPKHVHFGFPEDGGFTFVVDVTHNPVGVENIEVVPGGDQHKQIRLKQGFFDPFAAVRPLLADFVKG